MSTSATPAGPTSNYKVGAYRLMRGYVVLCGIGLLFSVFASQIALPGLYYDNGPAPPWWPRRVVGVALSLGYVMLLLVPYRWFVRGWAFRLRLAALLLVSLWLTYAVAGGIYGFLQGSKHVLVIPASILVLGLAVLAPGTLVLRRSWVGAKHAH